MAKKHTVCGQLSRQPLSGHQDGLLAIITMPLNLPNGLHGSLRQKRLFLDFANIVAAQ